MIEYIVLGIGAVIVVAVLFPAVRRPSLSSSRSTPKLRLRDNTAVPVDDRSESPPGRKRPSVTRKKNAAPGGQQAKTCPVCRSPLTAGERIKSVVYRDGVQHGEITEYTTHIFGCPHCYPANRRNPRICPVCRGEVNPDGHLVARMFERRGRKKHVRVLGCTACRTNRTSSG